MDRLISSGFRSEITDDNYDDNYLIHPYEFTNLVLGKSIPELELKEGQQMRMPAFYVDIVDQFQIEFKNIIVTRVEIVK